MKKLELERISGYYVSATKDAAANIRMQQYYNESARRHQNKRREYGLDAHGRSARKQTRTTPCRLEGGDNAFRYSLQGLEYNKINGVMKTPAAMWINGTVDLSYQLKRLTLPQHPDGRQQQKRRIALGLLWRLLQS